MFVSIKRPLGVPSSATNQASRDVSHESADGLSGVLLLPGDAADPPSARLFE
jgi:hypothetical protein